MAAAKKDKHPEVSGRAGFSRKFEVITPDDTNPQPEVYKAIINGGATGGTVICEDEDGNTVTCFVPAGGTLQGMRPTKVKTGGSATPLIGIKGEGKS